MPPPNPNDQVIGIDFSAGMASVTSQLNAALGSAGLQFSNTGSTLRVLDNGVGTATVNAASVTSTTSSLLGGSGEVRCAPRAPPTAGLRGDPRPV